MNRRQKKKAYKKKYGFNPPPKFEFTTEIDLAGIAKEAAKLGPRINEALKYITDIIFPTFTEMLISASNAVVETSHELIEEIKSMPEEDFEEFKKELSEGQIKICEKVRKKDE